MAFGMDSLLLAGLVGPEHPHVFIYGIVPSPIALVNDQHQVKLPV
jgi:hypothetical protein